MERGHFGQPGYAALPGLAALPILPRCSSDNPVGETSDAISAAQQPTPPPRPSPPFVLLPRFHKDYLARLMTSEQGKALAESKGEVAYGASFIQFFAEQAIRSMGETMPPAGPNKRIMVRMRGRRAGDGGRRRDTRWHNSF